MAGKRPPLAEEGGEELERRRTETRFLRLENMLSGARAEDVALVRSSSLSGGGDVDAMAMAMAIIEDDVRHAFQDAMREAISSALLLDDASDDGRGGVRGVVGGSCFRGGRRDGDDDDAGCSELSLGRSADSVNNAASGEFDPGRAGATVSPEPQADTLRRKRISGSNITPAGPGSNSPNDDDREAPTKRVTW